MKWAPFQIQRNERRLLEASRMFKFFVDRRFILGLVWHAVTILCEILYNVRGYNLNVVHLTLQVCGLIFRKQWRPTHTSQVHRLFPHPQVLLPPVLRSMACRPKQRQPAFRPEVADAHVVPPHLGRPLQLNSIKR
jgi:hypothetical protein